MRLQLLIITAAKNPITAATILCMSFLPTSGCYKKSNCAQGPRTWAQGPTPVTVAKIQITAAEILITTATNPITAAKFPITVAKNLITAAKTPITAAIILYRSFLPTSGCY